VIRRRRVEKEKSIIRKRRDTTQERGGGGAVAGERGKFCIQKGPSISARGVRRQGGNTGGVYWQREKEDLDRAKKRGRGGIKIGKTSPSRKIREDHSG